MARFAINSADGQSIRFVGCPTYNGTYLKPSFLEFREIASPTPIDWQVGDYVDYTSDSKCTRTGYRYKLYDIPQPTKKAAVSEYEGAIVYQNVQFFAPTKDLELCPFRDIVLADNNIHFSTRDDVSTFEPLSGIVTRLQANLDDWYGEGVWEIRIASGLPSALAAAISEAREFSVAGGSVLDAINKCYDIFDNIGWRFSVEDDVNVLTFGAANVTPDATNTTPTMKYGFASDGSRNGLNTIGKTQSNKDEFATRLYAYGSSRNMNFQYYRGDAEIKDAESLDIEHLMIPKRYWGKTDGKYDARKAFLANQAVELAWGKRAKYHYFDGSEDDEIYPSLEGMTIGLIREVKEEMEDTEYVPSETIYTDEDERVDYPKSVVNPADDGVKETGTRPARLTGTWTDTADTWEVGFLSGQTSRTRPIFMEDIALPAEKGTYKLSLAAGYGGKATATTSDTSWLAGFSLSLKVYHRYDKNGTTYQQLLATVPFDVNPPRTAGGAFEYSLPNFSTNINLRENGATNDRFYFGMEVTIHSAASSVEMVFTTTDNEIGYTADKFFAEDFTLTLKQIGFSINDRQALGGNGLATVFFNEGMCAGRGFVVKSCEYQSATDDWKLVCTRAYDESTGMAYPNDSYKITNSDRFVLLDIAMPDLYIKVAEERLYARASALLADISRIKPAYSPSIDAQMLAGNPFAIEEGMFMALQDTEVTGGSVEKIIIDSITISESEAAIPTYKVTLREEKGKTFRNGLNSGAVSSTPLTSAKTSEGSGASMNVSGGLASLTVGSVSAVLTTSQWVLGRGFAMASDIPTALSQLSTDATHRLVTDTQITAWAAAALIAHSHSNKSVLDGISSAKVTAWEDAATKAHSHANKTSVLDKLKWDAANNAIYIGDADNPINFYAFGNVSAGGIGQGGSGGDGILAMYIKTPSGRVRIDDIDTRAAEFGIKVNGTLATPVDGVISINTASGNVTSVALSVPTGFSVTGSPVTSSGTLAIGFASGYSLPTTAKQTSWDNKQDAITASNKLSASLVSGLATVATSGAYGDLSGKPTALSQFTNDSGYITGITSSMVTTALGYTPANNATVITFSDSGIYVSANFNNSALSVRAAQTYIECWDGAGGWWNWAAGKWITYGGTSSHFVKGDGSLDGTVYYHSGNLTKSTLGLGNVDNTADANKSVAYAADAGNAGQLGGLGGSRYFRKNLIHTSADCNTMEDNSFTILDRDAGSLTCANMPSGASIAGGYGVLTVKHGAYRNQMFFPYNFQGRIYTRSSAYTSGVEWGDWNGLALTSDIPTDNNQLTNGAGYITSSGSCAYASNAGNADTLGGNSASYFATASSLGNYLPLSGGTMTGDIVFRTESSNWNFGYTESKVRLLKSGTTPATGAPAGYCGGLSAISSYCGFQLVTYGGATEVLKFRKIADSNTWSSWRDIYHSGNCNNTSTAWSASSLTLNGAISGATTISAVTSVSAPYFRGNISYPTDYTARISTAGWYRFFVKGGLQNANGLSLKCSIGHGYNYSQTERYDLEIVIGYAGDIVCTQLAGVNGGSTQRITKVRVDYVNEGFFAVDFYTTEPNPNTYWVWGDGVGTYQSPALVSSPTGSTVEFELGNGMRTSGNFIASGNVGIGTTSPSEKLHVVGNIIASGQITARGIATTFADKWTDSAGNAHPWYGLDMRTPSSGAGVALSGYFGISLHTGGDNVTCNTNFVASGEVTAGSDARWKHNITPVLNGIDAIMKLQPSEWEWNSDNHKGSGLVAQQTREVLPHLVKEDGEGYLHLNYDGLHAYEISAIQSHETRIQQLERENAELKRQLQQLNIDS